MRAFAQKSTVSDERKRGSSPMRNRAQLAQSDEASFALRLQRAIGNQGILRLLQRDTGGLKENSSAAENAGFGRHFSDSGQALPTALRERFESSLGADLSRVRIHTGAVSARAAQAVHARAYTLGQDIHFNRGAYDPTSQEGQQVLAHEVAHTVQQAGASGFAGGMTEPGGAAELQADAAAKAIVAGRSARLSPQPASIARILETSLPRPQIDFPPGLLAACPTLADWRKLAVDKGLRSLVDAYTAVETAKAVYDTANAAVDTKDGAKPSQTVSEAAQKAASDYINASWTLSEQCRSLASKLYEPKVNLNPAAPETNPAPPQPAPIKPNIFSIDQGKTSPPPQPQPAATADAVAAKLAGELSILADQQSRVIGGAVRSSRHAKQAAATFLAHYREPLPFAWSTVQEANDAAIMDWFRYYELNLPQDKNTPQTTGDDATVFFNGSDVRYGDVLDQFISEAKKAGFLFDREHVWEVTSDFLNRRAQVEGRLKGETKHDEKKAPASVALVSQINFTGHRTLEKHPVNSQDPPTWQVTGQVTVPLHPDGKAGFEITAQASVSFVMTQDGKIVNGTVKFSDPQARATNVQLAGQLAWVKPFLEGALQFQAFAQVVGGANWVEDPKQGGQSLTLTTTAARFSAAGMVQGVGGMQLVFVVPGTAGHLQLFVQLQASVTGTYGQPGTLDLQGATGAQFQFNLP